MLIPIIFLVSIQSALLKGPYWSLDSSKIKNDYKVCEDSNASRGFRVISKNSDCSTKISLANFYVEHYLEFDKPSPSIILNCDSVKTGKWHRCKDQLMIVNRKFQSIRLFKCDDSWLISTIFIEKIDIDSYGLVNKIQRTIRLQCP